MPIQQRYQSKTELALGLIDQAQGWGLPPRPLIADSAFGNSFEFREALRQRQCHYVMAVEPSTVVWTADPLVTLPPAHGRARPRRYPPLTARPEAQALSGIAHSLPASAWKPVTGRQGSRGPQRSRFALVAVWAAQGWRAQKQPPRGREWLLIDWPADAEDPVKYWLGWMGERTAGRRRWVRLAQARWRIEQDYRELKQALGLDHYEGRQWLGWHHHVTLVSVAFAPANNFQVASVAKSGTDAHLTWNAMAGRSYIVQTNSPGPNGNFNNTTWADLSPTNRVVGGGATAGGWSYAGQLHGCWRGGRQQHEPVLPREAAGRAVSVI